MSDKKDFFSKSLTKTKAALITAAAVEPIDPQVQINTVIKEIQDGGVQRLTLDIPLELHRRIKIRAAERGMSIKDFAVSIFEKELLG
jgi:hypothetical protein